MILEKVTLMFKVLKYSVSAYCKNITLISFFSIPMRFALLIPLFIQTPVYLALGGVFLRTGSIPDITSWDIGIMVFSFLVSLFLISFAMVNINLVIKSMRTSVLITHEVISGIGKYTINVFWLFLTLQMIIFILQFLLFGTQHASILYPILTMLAALPFFYTPSALVIDDYRPWRAIQKSVSYSLSKLPLFVMWLVVGFLMLALNELVFYALIPQPYSTYVVLFINSVIIMPFLIVLSTQVYLSKYTILP